MLGTLSPALCEELGCAAATVISVCEHDTASAIVAIPTQEKNPLYLSSGTWSLMGTELDEPIVTDMNFTNEGGYHHTIRYLKNIAGLWLIQESRRAWSRQGMDFTFGELEAMAVEAGPAESFIDPDDPVFATAGDVPERIRRYCERTRQPIPQSTGQVVRCIYESLARRYAQTKLLLEQATGTQYHTLHIIGGGIKDTFLCQMTANYTGCRVLAGPAEATALGNIAVQLIAMGELQDLHHARRVIAAGVTLTEYLPMV
ncbi:MAG: FGGY-family carbohydrate kinase [Angelakisella sp.]